MEKDLLKRVPVFLKRSKNFPGLRIPAGSTFFLYRMSSFSSSFG